MMTRALEHLDSAGVACVKLDATPAGLPLYRRLGFEREVLFERWQGTAARVRSHDIALVESASVGPMLRVDRAAFGADRSLLLAMLEAEALATYVVCEAEPHADGYALARAGRIATYLGPIISTDVALAERLFDALSTRVAGQQVIIDVNTGGLLDRARLAERGLSPARPLMRMRRGNAGAETPATLCASAGPECG